MSKHTPPDQHGQIILVRSDKQSGFVTVRLDARALAILDSALKCDTQKIESLTEPADDEVKKLEIVKEMQKVIVSCRDSILSE